MTHTNSGECFQLFQMCKFFDFWVIERALELHTSENCKYDRYHSKHKIFKISFSVTYNIDHANYISKNIFPSRDCNLYLGTGPFGPPLPTGVSSLYSPWRMMDQINQSLCNHPSKQWFSQMWEDMETSPDPFNPRQLASSVGQRPLTT